MQPHELAQVTVISHAINDPGFQRLNASVRRIWSETVAATPESRPVLVEWFHKASRTAVASFAALRQTFGSADYVDGYTIFDVGGNRYRIAAVIHYDKQRLYVPQVMTHAEYDRNVWRKR